MPALKVWALPSSNRARTVYFETRSTWLVSQPSDWRLVNRLSSEPQRRALNEALPVWIGRHQRAAARVAEHGKRLFVDVAQAAGVLWGRLLERITRWWREDAWGRDSAGRRRGPRPRAGVPPPAHAHVCLVLRE